MQQHGGCCVSAQSRTSAAATARNLFALPAVPLFFVVGHGFMMEAQGGCRIGLAGAVSAYIESAEAGRLLYPTRIRQNECGAG